MALFTVFVSRTETVVWEVEAASEAEAREEYTTGNDVDHWGDEPFTVDRVVQGRVEYVRPFNVERVVPDAVMIEYDGSEVVQP